MIAGLYTHLAAAGAALAVGVAATAWVQAQHYGLQIEKLEHTATAKDLRGANQTVEDMAGFQKGLNDALTNFQATQQRNAESQKAMGQLLVDLRGTTSGLRSDLAGLPTRIAAASQPALAEYATTCTAVLNELADRGERMAQRGGDIAAKAEGHAADVRLMQEAWPGAN